MDKNFFGLSQKEFTEDQLKVIADTVASKVAEFRKETNNITYHDFKDGKGPVPAHRHCKGKGWVADTTTVENTVYVGLNAQVYGYAQVAGDAKVAGDAQVYGDASVYGDARVSGNAQVSGDAWVSGNAEVLGNAKVYGDARVSGNAKVYGDAWVSQGYFS